MADCKNCYDVIKENQQTVSCSHCGRPMHYECAQQCIKCSERILCDKCAPQHKWKCNICEDIAIHEMEFISSTMFEAYEKCPFLFKDIFIINKGIEVPNKYSRTGQELHNLFDRWSYETIKEETLMIEQYKDQFDTIDPDLFDGEEDIKKFFEQGVLTIQNWIDEEENKPLPLMTEQVHFVKLHPELPPIRATIDRINGVEEFVSEWEVEDYKTGKVYSAQKLRDNMQLPIYAMVIRAVYGALPTKLRLRFPLHKTERVFERITDDMYTCQVKRGGTYNISLTETLNNMVKIYKNIKQDTFLPNTQDTHFCVNFCPLSKQEKCHSFDTAWTTLMKRGY